MRYITFAEYLAAAGVSNDQLKVRRSRDREKGSQVALAFGRGGEYGYETDFFIELDAVATHLSDVLAEKLDRTLAAAIVRDQWGIWMRVAAMAEAQKQPVFFYVMRYKDKKENDRYMTAGSLLDSRDQDNLQKIAIDTYKRFGVTLRDFVVVEMQSVLADVRANAKRKRFDLSAAFLPPYGDPRLDEVLQSYDEAMPDRAIVVDEKGQRERADVAARAGKKARGIMESMLH